MSATCKSCGDPIEWRQTPAGKRIPIDPEPVEGGNLELVGQSIAKVVKAGTGTHVSHFATCPNASSHRRPR